MPSSELYQVGGSYRGFVTTKVVPLNELCATLIECKHVSTGARVMHIASKDEENLFCLSFKTLPESSNGVAHVLEHTVLCGSKKFPVKDPFFAMQRRSLTTFMNAFTGADFTCYPAASQLSKDFYNLLEVYLDAVFEPHLRRLSFLQEGWRLEQVDLNDSRSPLTYKGIVYNEMKGAMSSPDRRLDEALQAALFPDVAYGYNSGGDPKVIPDLSYEELLRFHADHYHPSRCLFFFYGNLPLEGHLDCIAKLVLEQADPKEPLPPPPDQPRFSQPKALSLSYPAEEGEKEALIAIGWLTCPIVQQRELLSLQLLAMILMDTDASPLKKRLLRSGLCKQVALRFDSESHEASVSLFFHGCKAGVAEELEEFVLKTLEEIAKEGISDTLIETALHQMEFHRSEINGEMGPFGLTLFFRAALMQQHGGEPERGLLVHTLFDELRTELQAQPGYFSKLIEHWLLGNAHRVRVELLPDETLAEREAAEEGQRLATVESLLDQKQREAIAVQGQQLATFQRSEEGKSLEVLPKVTLSDVPKEGKNYPVTIEKYGSVAFHYHEAFTNNILYVALNFSLPPLTDEELPYLRLLTLLLPQIGSGGRDWSATLDEMQAYTGGLAVGLQLHPQVSDPNSLSPTLFFEGKALYRNDARLFSLLKEMVLSADLTDRLRLRELLTKHWSGLQMGVVDHALRYAMNLSQSSFGLAPHIMAGCYGLHYYQTVKKWVEEIDEQIDLLIERLQELQQKLLHETQAELVVTASEAEIQRLKQERLFGLDGIGTGGEASWQGWEALGSCASQGRAIASSVACTALTIPVCAYAHPDAPATSVASNLFDNLVLHRAIREEGGAYGGGSSYYPMSATFTFYAYRDPHIRETLAAFTRAAEQIGEGRFDDRELEEAKLQLFQQLDQPISPGSRGDLTYSRMRQGKTDSVRQAFRDRLFSLTRADVMRVVRNSIIPQIPGGVTVVFGGRSLLEKEKTLPIFTLYD